MQSAMQQREEKLWENTIEALLSRLNELKNNITSLLIRLDTESDRMDWPTFLNNFALICSHLNSITKLLSKDTCPSLRNRAILPLMLSHEPDPALALMTEGRLPMFSHDIIPDYMRTKPDPQVEQKMLSLEQKAATLTADAANKQVTQYNKVVSHVLDILTKAREEWENESSSRAAAQQTSSMADTQMLLAAINTGQGLKMLPMSGVPGGAGPSGMMPQLRAAGPISPGAVNLLAKANIKTNIKSAAHPLNR